MRRHAHALKGNKGSETPSRFIFFDTETTPRQSDRDYVEHVFRLGVACYWQRPRDTQKEHIVWRDLRDKDALWLFIDDMLRPHTRIVLLAHNTGFDLQVIGGASSLERHGWKIRKAIVDDPPFIIRATRETCSILILDWYNYFRGSLAAAGQFLNVPKMRMPHWDAPDSDWSVYCRNDVLVLFEAVRQYVAFVEENDLGTMAHTLAGQSLNAYRHRFMEYPILIHDRRSAIALERRAYYGGRVEMFRKHKLPAGEYSYFDINSAYPAVMRSEEFPTSLISVDHGASLTRLEKLCRDNLVIADVGITTERPLYPLRTDGRLLFPVGKFTTTLATPELITALQRNHVTSVGKYALYTKAPIFRNWVDSIYALRKQARQEGNLFYDEMLKRMLNSLFGKFGQRNLNWIKVAEEKGHEDAIWKDYNADTGKVTTYRRLGGIKEERVAVEEGFNSFVAIAAHVTSSARTLLLAYLESAGWEHVYYCDTDSLIVDEAGAGSLAPAIHPNELGKLKLVDRSTDVLLNAPKNYVFGDMEKHKGRRMNALPVEGGGYIQDQFTSWIGALRLGWQGGPRMGAVLKRDALTYNKGVLHDDGSITPIRYDDLSTHAPEVIHNDRDIQRPKIRWDRFTFDQEEH